MAAYTLACLSSVKKKALALLERAEGLSDWVTSVMANSPVTDSHHSHSHSHETTAAVVDAAFAASQRAHEQALSEKEALVAQMKTANSEMTQKLNQLVLLTKVRTRFRRVLSERRARKAAAAAEQEARRSASVEDAENNANSGNRNDVEGDDDDSDLSLSASSLSSSGRWAVVPAPASLERETQKRDLINELHARIGLPEISTLRKFTPLSADATKDFRHVELEDELEAARLEAERLRAAVQEMEDAFRATLELTRRASLKLNQQKDEDLAQMEDELQRVRDELELERSERRLSASLYSGGGSNKSDDDPDAYEDVAMIRSLRSSLHAMAAPPGSSSSSGRADDSRPQGREEEEEPTRAFRTGWAKSESEGDSSDADISLDDDGGVWL